MALYLEGKTPLARMIFPSRRQLNESRHQVYRHGRAQGSDRDRGAERQWQAGDGVDRGNQSQQHSAVYPRSARRVACDLGRRDLGGLALRSATTPGNASAGLRSAAQCLIKGRQQERQDRCAQVGRLVAHGDVAPGLSRGTRAADAARAGAQLSDPQPRSEPGDEPDQSSVSRLEHPLCRYPGVCSAISGRVATEDRACGGAPAGRVALSTVGWIAGVKTNPAPRVTGGEPETQSCETAASDSLHRSDPSRPPNRVDADATPLPQQTATLDL